MARDAVFLDTAGLLGVFLPTDSLHRRAQTVLDALGFATTPLVVSDWVLVEFLNATSAKADARESVAFARSFFGAPRTTVVPATRAGLLGAMNYKELRPDKRWSLVDCASMLTCKEMGIRRVFTHDHHFEQAGLEILL